MTLSTIIDTVRDYLQGMSYRGQVVTTSEIVKEANHALRTIGLRTKPFDPSITLTLTAGQSVYNTQDPSVVSKLLNEAYSVTINGNMLWDSQYYSRTVQSLQELEDRRPGWRTMASGTPDIAVWYTSNSLLVSCPPNSTVAASGNNYIAGFYVPGAYLSTGGYSASGMSANDTLCQPDLDINLQDCLCYLTAQYLMFPLVKQAAWTRIQAYNNEWVQIAEQVRRTNERAIAPYGIGRTNLSEIYWGR